MRGHCMLLRFYMQLLFLTRSLTLLHSDRPKLRTILAFLSAMGLTNLHVSFEFRIKINI